ncbi:hypothetical protein MtrunA17_Chr5g0413221 [Medicago truncatula]|uniref:Uncharacterized protein n=1 Tax=Medicago truncatula TaxID=3880 RepID=A0A396HRC3_MEDTR|nr:hypothetical protein MtrunA17_Chr5g0413221 [Medicago truncatula]
MMVRLRRSMVEWEVLVATDNTWPPKRIPDKNVSNISKYDSDVEEEVEGKGCAEVDDCP